MNPLDGVVKEFLVESHENLDQLDRDLVALEKDPENKEGLASIFRTIHTIKGTCGFFGFSKLEAVTHVGENLLGKLRDLEGTASRERRGWFSRPRPRSNSGRPPEGAMGLISRRRKNNYARW